jgi:chemotaxis protein MotA
MFAIIGFVVVLGCIVGGYLLEKGNLLVLLQPSELLIIGGAAAGSVLIGNPPHILKKVLGCLLGVFKGSEYTATRYLDTLKFLGEFFNNARKNGLASLENDIEEPENSELLKKHAGFSKDKRALQFFCDTMRTISMGAVGYHELDQVMETDLEVLHKQSRLPVGAINSVADGLPGLGIVAAVLGIVITMQALGGPPEEIGHKVAAALVGTFLGVLMCYGFFGPLASNMAKEADAEGEYFQCLRMAILAYMKGVPPILALEAARRAIPDHIRPTFQEMDKAWRAPAAGQPESTEAAA